MKARCLLWACLAAIACTVAAEPSSIRDGFSLPITELQPAEREQFFRGRALFRQSWTAPPASAGTASGLGPLYNRLACVSCHARNGRGHAPDAPDERMQSMLVRLSVPGTGPHGAPRPHPAYGDQLNEEGVPGVPGEGRAELRWHVTPMRLADGTPVALRQPRVRFTELAYGPLGPVRFSLRVSPAVAGLGLLEAVPEDRLRALAEERKPDGVRGKVNQVWDVAADRMVPGRFGLKANAPNLRQQSAGAFLGDMGITSALFPRENCMPAQTQCLRSPSAGHPELTDAQLDDVEFYLAHLAAPPRRQVDAPEVVRGEQVFAQLGCAVCHRPDLGPARHARFGALDGRAIPAYTDLLLHDMGPALADGRPDYAAGAREWRTAPLWGLGLARQVNERAGFLHDARARSFEEAILWHGGEAATAQRRYVRLDAQARRTLAAFLDSL